MRRRRAAAALAALAWLGSSGCEPALPDPDSPGARLYRNRCGGCHRLYAPGSMTSAMWGVQVERMQAEFVRRGVPVLTPTETEALLGYLGRHSLEMESGG
jgi:hypothetical protein